MTHHIVPLSEEVSDCKVESGSHSDSIVKASSIMNFGPGGKILTAAYYVEVLSHLQDKIRSERQEIWIQQHSDVPSHMSMSVQHFLIEVQITFVPQPLYLATCAFWFLRKKKLGFMVDVLGRLKRRM